MKKNSLLPEHLLEAFERTLYRGGYHMLLGSGVSLSSVDKMGRQIRSAETLRSDLCNYKEVRSNSSLSRVCSLLNDEEKRILIMEDYSDCIPSRIMMNISNYNWKSIFTFNIDDVIQNVYKNSDSKQDLKTVHFRDAYTEKESKKDLYIIHLHGSVLRWESGVVFSHMEYAQLMRDTSVWSMMLGELIVSEPFIISGTSLNEIDLEFYLSKRNSITRRKDLGPSILIEPSPDEITRHECKRLGFELIESSFDEFLEWIVNEYPEPPTIEELAIYGDKEVLEDFDTIKRLRFLSDFEKIKASDVNRLDVSISPFYYGSPPSWNDIVNNRDVDRHQSSDLYKRISANLKDASKQLIILMSDPGGGKTTILKRVGFNMSRDSYNVFFHRGMSGIDVDVFIEAADLLPANSVFLVDNLASHIDQVYSILNNINRKDIAFVGADRKYRIEYIKIASRHLAKQILYCDSTNANESETIIENYRNKGIVADRKAISDPGNYAYELSREVVAIQICRIMNDFKPFDDIIATIWNDSDYDIKMAYGIVSLAHYCYGQGLRYSLLQNCVGQHVNIDHMINENVTLPLTINPLDEDFIIPSNTVVSSRILTNKLNMDSSLMLDVFVRLALALSPYVNRHSIVKKTPEAKISGRLFDYDKVTEFFLGEKSYDFFAKTKYRWEWNSRYWEQRALMMVNRDLNVAISHARQAVAIERHPFGLTTLANILVKKMSINGMIRRDVFEEAIHFYEEAIRIENYSTRITIHPYIGMFKAINIFLRNGEDLYANEMQLIDRVAISAENNFSQDLELMKLIREYENIKWGKS